MIIQKVPLVEIEFSNDNRPIANHSHAYNRLTICDR